MIVHTLFLLIISNVFNNVKKVNLLYKIIMIIVINVLKIVKKIIINKLIQKELHIV